MPPSPSNGKLVDHRLEPAPWLRLLGSFFGGGFRGFREGLGFRGFRGFRVQGLGFRGFREGLGFRVQGLFGAGFT